MSFVPASFRCVLPSVAPHAFGRRTALLAAGLFLAGACRLSAQAPGTQDTSFLAVENGITFYTQLLEYIDGSPVLFIGGDTDGLNEFVINTATATSAGVDGSDYSRFGDEGIGPDIGNAARIIYTAVPEVVPPPVGTTPYLLVGGLFGRSAAQVTANQPGQNIFRLDPFGNVDMSFKPGKGADNYVTSILPLADGGMVVGGEFEQFNKLDHLRIVRLDSTGNIVSSSVFDPNLSFDATVLSLDAQLVDGARNGQILVAGQFSNVDGKIYNKLVRLNADGSVDTSFHPNFDNRTVIVKSQPDGKILVGGDFENVSGTAAKHIVRLNYDGSVDSTFTAQVTVMPAGFANPTSVYVIQLLSDGGMYLGGNFAAVDGVTRNFLAKVDATGALDTTFDPGKTVINAIQSLVVQPNGRLLVGENLSKSLDNTQTRPPSLIRLFGQAPVIDIATTDATITPRTDGAFTLTRAGSALTVGPLTVYVIVGGNAKAVGKTIPATMTMPARMKTPDYDFAALGLGPSTIFRDGNNNPLYTVYAVTFPANQTTLTLPVVVERTTDFNKRDSRDVTLTLVGDQSGMNNYAVGTPAATVVINNQ